jgi:hypothetical protein
VTKKIFSFDLKRIFDPVAAVGASQSTVDSTDDPNQRDELLETILVAFHASEKSAAKNVKE